MSATMMDGERRTQLLAWGTTAPIENHEHWNWFGYQLRQGLARGYEEQKQEEQEGGDGGEEQKGDGGEGRKGRDGEEGKNPRPPPISRALAIFTDCEKGLQRQSKTTSPTAPISSVFSILRRTS